MCIIVGTLQLAVPFIEKNKKYKVWNWQGLKGWRAEGCLPHPCLLGGPKEGGNAT